ncbi:MAG TPA: hypothetical protein VJN70_21470 [Gemmatimonadaceae bacterium]|nr:hypothetical protein [Gemmatimonadaceae bacterium]
MEDAALGSLLRDLQGLKFDREDKASDLELLLDYLEIVAVAAGEKPSHLQGQGMRSKSLLDGIERVAAAHGLRVMRTGVLLQHFDRAPSYDARFAEWQDRRERDARVREGQVLWVYRDAGLEPAIRAAADGETDVADVLGYPACCVREYNETGVRICEAIVRRYQTEYGAKDLDDLIRLAKSNTKVTIPPSERPQVRHPLPYVQFLPCLNCAESPRSPAAEINWAMKRLATQLSPAFQRAIDKAVKAEVAFRKQRNRR